MSNDSDNDRKFTVTITLKSGVQHVMQCDELTVSRNVYGDLRELKWKNADIDIMHLDMSEVAAVVSKTNDSAAEAA